MMRARRGDLLIPVTWLMAFLTLWDGTLRAVGPHGSVVGAVLVPTLSDAAMRRTALSRPPWQPPTVPQAMGTPGPAPVDRFVQQQLDRIGPGAAAAYAFVRDAIGFETYVGSLRGARGTLWSGAGNALDKASLLRSLLEAQGLGARFVRGRLSEADALRLVQAQYDPVVAASAVGYVPSSFVTYDPASDSGLIRQVQDHWWVELDDGTPLDPSFPHLDFGHLPGTPEARFAAIPEEWRHAVVIRLQVELHNPLSQYTSVTPLEVSLPTEEVYGRALTLGHFIGVQQSPAVVTGWKTYTYTPYLLVDDNDDDPGNNRLIRGTDYQEFLTGLFPLANSILTRLTLEFEVRGPGREPEVHSRDLLDRVGYAARHGLAPPVGPDTTRPALTELDLTTFFITPGLISPEVVPPHQAVLAGLDPELTGLLPRVAALTNRPPGTWSADETTAANRLVVLDRTALIAGGSVVAAAFLLDSDHYLRQMRDAHQVRAYYASPRLTLFESHVDVSGPEPVLRLGLDLRRNHVRIRPYPGQNAFQTVAFNMVKGHVDSLLEYLTVERLLAETRPEVHRVAAPVRVLEEARRSGVPIRVLAGESDIPWRLEPLALSAEAKARIGDALRAGRVVNVPVTTIAVDGEPAVGWWELDRTTGEVIAVGETGGRQSVAEFVLLGTVLGVGSVQALSVLARDPPRLFTQPSSPAIQYAPFAAPLIGSDRLRQQGQATPPVAWSAAGGPLGVDYEYNEDGRTMTLVVDGIRVVGVPADLSLVTEAVGSSGSVVDWAGSDLEVIARFSPGPLTHAVPAPTVAAEFTVDLQPEQSFVVKHRENPVPSAFRVSVDATGLPDPGTLVAYRGRTNETFFFRVTGSRTNRIWGTDVYTDTSSLGSAAVHAGVLTGGQAGVVKVRLLPSQGAYAGSLRHGTSSLSYNGWNTGSFRVAAVDPRTDLVIYALSGAAAPGWQVLLASTNTVLPYGSRAELSVFLQPDAALPLPSPATPVVFSVDVVPSPGTASGWSGVPGLATARPGSRLALAAASGASGAVRLERTFVVPEVAGMGMTAEPTLLHLSPDGSAAFRVRFENTGNVPIQADLSPSVPAGFGLDGLMRSVSLAPDASQELELTLRALGAVVNSEQALSLTARFGPEREAQREVRLRALVAVPGSHSALQAAGDARALTRHPLAETLESVGRGLSGLYGEPSDVLQRDRLVATLETLIRQLDDPLLAPFVPGLAKARSELAAADAVGIRSALEVLGVAMDAVAARVSTLARHDFEIALQPNVAEAVPETAASFGLYLKNLGRETTTYALRLVGLPDGVTGGLTQSSIALAPGQATSPTLTDVEHVAVRITPDAGVLPESAFRVSATATAAPEVVRTTEGVLIAREEWVRVLEVDATPGFLEPRWEQTRVGVVTGGDPGEGLDLDGEFPYAVNVGGPAIGAIRDAVFTGPEVPGVTLVATWQNPNAHGREFGSSTADDRLEQVIRSDRFGDATHPIGLELAGLSPGRAYRLQLLFAEDWTAKRGFDVRVDGKVIINDLNLGGVQGGVSSPDRAVVVSHTFLADRATVGVALDGTAVAEYANRGPLLCGFTLEALPPRTIDVSVRVLNAVNSDRPALAHLTVTGPDGTIVRQPPPEPVRLTTLASLETFAAGSFDATGLAPGPAEPGAGWVYRLDVGLTELDGTAIPGGQGTGRLLVGAPVAAELSVAPIQLPPGDGGVDLDLEIRSLLDFGPQGLALVGLRDTPGIAQSGAIFGQTACLGSTEGGAIVDVANPWNPTLAGGLGTNELTTARAGDRLLIRRGFGVEVVAVDPSGGTTSLGTAPAGFEGATFPLRFLSHGGFAFSQSLIFGYTDHILFVRGDLVVHDIRDASRPVPMGLFFGTPHDFRPENVGSDFFVGAPDARDGMVFLPSTTGPGAATSGLGRLLVLDARHPGAVRASGELPIPGTRVLTGIAVAGDRALVLGNTEGFVVGLTGPELTGEVTATVVDVSDPEHPAVAGPTHVLGGFDRSGRWRMIPFAGPPGWFFLGEAVRDGKPLLVAMGAADPAQLVPREFEVPSSIHWAQTMGSTLYTTSSSGLAIYELGGWLGLPVSVEVLFPGAAASVIPDAFVPVPATYEVGPDGERALWELALDAAQPSRRIRWRASVAGLQPGTSRPVVVGGSVRCTALGATSSIVLPAVSVSCPHLLQLAPGTREARPGGLATYTLSITNPADRDLEFRLAASGLPEGWIGGLTSTRVRAHGGMDLPLTLRTKATAPPGVLRFHLAADAGAGWQDAVDGRLVLGGLPQVDDRVHGLTVGLEPRTVVTRPGGPGRCVVRLTNTGNESVRCRLRFEGVEGIDAAFTATEFEVPPGFDGYRESLLRLSVPPLVPLGSSPFQVSADPIGVLEPPAVAEGRVEILPGGLGVALHPGVGTIGDRFTLGITNLASFERDIRLSLAGPLAVGVSLGEASLRLGAGLGREVAMSVADAGQTLPGKSTVTVLATPSDDPSWHAEATAQVSVPVRREMSVECLPSMAYLEGAGSTNLLLLLRNRGNAEERVTVELLATHGPVRAEILDPDGEAWAAADELRLPAFGTGLLLVRASLDQSGIGDLEVGLRIAGSPMPAVTALAGLQTTDGLRIRRREGMEIQANPVPRGDAFLEWAEQPTPSGPWREFDGEVLEAGHYLDRSAAPARYYRLRLTESERVGLEIERGGATEITFTPRVGWRTTVQYRARLEAGDDWQDLPGGPHLTGQVIDRTTDPQRFYRLRP